MASMRTRRAEKKPAAGLSGKERGALDEFLAYVEFRVKDVEPGCARLVREARLALAGPNATEIRDGMLH